MRIDKFLWSIRVYKTRSQATEACRNGHVKIKEIQVKPAKEISVGDIIQIRLHSFSKTIQVLDFPKSRVGAKLVNLYALDLTPEEEYKKLDMVREKISLQRPKGSGRPTKKERRDIEKWLYD